MLLNLAKKHGVRCDELENYVQNRDAVIAMVVGLRPDLTAPMVKNAFNTATAVADYAYHYTNNIPVLILDEPNGLRGY